MRMRECNSGLASVQRRTGVRRHYGVRASRGLPPWGERTLSGVQKRSHHHAFVFHD